eukprot:CAMPEP_0179962794 /NCGR_PEP_ID=MMETSP0983-20121128/30414_1 /TAXON_ID=483367 /ORGANISM="non described non described, Strain CCMP 2436" /LENGTH=113 /DNA_ID=CAMNT_0021875335 /DNA_START=745 /DNA_END=1083 /DNA_ORIENTATION=-
MAAVRSLGHAAPAPVAAALAAAAGAAGAGETARLREHKLGLRAHRGQLRAYEQLECHRNCDRGEGTDGRAKRVAARLVVGRGGVRFIATAAKADVATLEEAAAAVVEAASTAA